MGLNTRNLNDNEVEELEELHRTAEEAALDLQECADDLRLKYELPEEATMDPRDGRFVIQNKPVDRSTDAAQATRSERKTLCRLQAKAAKTRTAIKRFTAKLRRACDAPHFAKLDTRYRWIAPDTGELLAPEPDELSTAGEENVDEQA